MWASQLVVSLGIHLLLRFGFSRLPFAVSQTPYSAFRMPFTSSRLPVRLMLMGTLCALQYYTPAILELAGLRDNRTALLVAMLPAAVNSAGTLIGMWQIDKCGRRQAVIIIIVIILVSILLSSSWSSMLCHHHGHHCHHCALSRRVTGPA